MTTRRRRPRPPDGPASRDARVVTRYAFDAVIAAALLAGKKVADIERDHGIGRATVSSRMADPEFRALLEQERNDILRAVRDLVGSQAIKSVEALAAIRDNEKATWSSRVRASVELLRLATGTPSLEINQTTIVAGGSDANPADALAAFLGKLQDRAVALPSPDAPPPIDVEVTEL